MRYRGSGTSPTCDQGFTLIEALIVLVIVCLLFGLGIPGLRQVMASSRGSAAMMELHALLNTARQAAVTNVREVTVCGTVDGSSCLRDWHGKAMVFIDRDENRRFTSGDTMLAEEQIDIGGELRWRGSGGRNYIRFRSNGTPKEFGTMVWCPKDKDARFARGVIISFTGRPRAATDRDGDGYRENAQGDRLHCP